MISKHHHLKLLLLCFVSCSSGDEAAQKSQTEIVQPASSVDKLLIKEIQCEERVAESLAAKIAGQKPLDLKSPELSKYLSLIAQSLARHTSRPYFQYKVGILKDPSVNAYSASAGFLFVSEGLLKLSANEHELAGILAHELAHVAEKHVIQKSCEQRQIGIGETMARAMSRGGGEVGEVTSSYINQALETLLDIGLGPKLEGDADIMGVSLAHQAGYNAWALHDFLDRLAKQIETAKVPKSKTHPPFQERLKFLENFLKSEKFAKVSQLNDKVLAKRFKAAMKGMHP